MHHLGHQFFLAVGHDVDAGDAGHLLDLLHDLDADPLAFLLLVVDPFQAVGDGVGNVDAGDVGADPARRLGRSQGADADQWDVSSLNGSC